MDTVETLRAWAKVEFGMESPILLDLNAVAAKISRLRAALAAETQRADREAAEVTVQVEARRELEVTLAEAERERDEAITSYMAICDGNTAWKHIIARVGEAEKLYAAMKDKLALAEIALATRDTAFEAETARAERAEAALAAETQRADREAAEVTVQVEARRELEAALAAAERLMWSFARAVGD